MNFYCIRNHLDIKICMKNEYIHTFNIKLRSQAVNAMGKEKKNTDIY